MTAPAISRQVEPTENGSTAGAPGPGRDQAREELGRAHYERMRDGIAPALALPPWSQLTEPQREAHRERIDYLVPVVLCLLAEQAVSLSHPILEETR